ncbi:hypothetical protein [Falsiroseomonas oryziterrae]|uniref:hypothetical protein n=1 Tax=Falsiroseomonas oryziterrae TaxID=2911368 RepID=UPI001F3952F3|nr:hypothetical protein [Roseomonas sp. NPKOSM-4]
MVTPDPQAEPETVILDFPDTEENRLRRALRDLEAAMRDQRDAVTNLRSSLAGLGGSIARLGTSTAELHASLAQATDQPNEGGDAAGPLGPREDAARR